MLWCHCNIVLIIGVKCRMLIFSVLHSDRLTDCFVAVTSGELVGNCIKFCDTVPMQFYTEWLENRLVIAACCHEIVDPLIVSVVGSPHSGSIVTCFLAECRKRQLNQDCFVLLCFALFAFCPRDAMLAWVIVIATCTSVRLSRAGIVSKRRKLAAWFLHHLIAPRL